MLWAVICYNQNMRDVYIVTGASSGMGRDFALEIAREFPGEKELWLIARREDLLNSISVLLKEEFDNLVVRIFPLDISGEVGSEKFNEILLKEQEREEFVVKGLVNNAGFGTYGPFAETDYERQLSMIEVNVYALTAFTYRVVPFLKTGSFIINVASLASFLPLGNFAVYGATKAYVLSFTTALAAELKDSGIHVMSLCPGPVSTEFAKVASKGARKEVLHGKDPLKVVRHCIRALKRKKHFAFYGLDWKFKAFICRFIGRYFGARMTYKYAKRPSN